MQSAPPAALAPASGYVPRASSRRTCALQSALGSAEACRGSGRCPFWEEGGAVLDPGCLLERLLPAEHWTPDLTARWVRLRRLLQRARLSGRQPRERALFALVGSGERRM